VSEAVIELPDEWSLAFWIIILIEDGYHHLTTDFGLKDGNVGVMKGVIWSIALQAQIADLSHLIGPQNIPEQP